MSWSHNDLHYLLNFSELLIHFFRFSGNRHIHTKHGESYTDLLMMHFLCQAPEVMPRSACCLRLDTLFINHDPLTLLRLSFSMHHIKFDGQDRKCRCTKLWSSISDTVSAVCTTSMKKKYTLEICRNSHTESWTLGGLMASITELRDTQREYFESALSLSLVTSPIQIWKTHENSVSWIMDTQHGTQQFFLACASCGPC